MATHASALKAHRQSVKHREHNRDLRTKLRSALKTIRGAISSKDIATAKGQLKSVTALIDRMASKGIIHANAAARYKSRLSRGIASISTAA